MKIFLLDKRIAELRKQKPHEDHIRLALAELTEIPAETNFILAWKYNGQTRCRLHRFSREDRELLIEDEAHFYDDVYRPERLGRFCKECSDFRVIMHE